LVFDSPGDAHGVWVSVHVVVRSVRGVVGYRGVCEEAGVVARPFGGGSLRVQGPTLPGVWSMSVTP
jgi:hypothetical protein